MDVLFFSHLQTLMESFMTPTFSPFQRTDGVADMTKHNLTIPRLVSAVDSKNLKHDLIHQTIQNEIDGTRFSGKDLFILY